jgi:hypothetical protein
MPTKVSGAFRRVWRLKKPEVEDPDDAAVDEVDQSSQTFTRQLRSGELEGQIVDGAQVVVGHAPPPVGSS